MLKDEIKKPYFLDLKRFLWEAGLKSASNTPLDLPIHPPGTATGARERCCIILIVATHTAKDIYAWAKTPLGKVKVVIIGQGTSHLSKAKMMAAFAGAKSCQHTTDPYHGPGQAHGA